MGFVNLQTSYAPLSLLKEMKSKKAQHRWRCVPLNVLTQGSLHYRLATLGYQKQNPDGVCQFANILCAAFPIERDEIKKAQHLRRCVPLNVLTQGSSLRSPTLGYQKQKAMGFVYSANILCLRPPLSLERGWG